MKLPDDLDTLISDIKRITESVAHARKEGEPVKLQMELNSETKDIIKDLNDLHRVLAKVKEYKDSNISFIKDGQKTHYRIQSKGYAYYHTKQAIIHIWKALTGKMF